MAFCFSQFTGYTQGLSNRGGSRTAPTLNLPAPGTMIGLSQTSDLPVLKGLRLDPKNPLRIDFIVDTHEQTVAKADIQVLINYFLAGLTMPQKDIWVNLDPQEQDRVLNNNLDATDLGQGLLEEDYILKQLAASLTYPETEAGKRYWDEMNGVGATPRSRPDNNGQAGRALTNNLNKVWIVPEISAVYENKDTALISKVTLGVKTEDNNVAFEKNILPLIKEEVNHGKNFAQLRQIYNSLVLAVWFKNKFKESFYRHYIDHAQMSGLDLNDPQIKDKVFNLYVEAFHKGAYNVTKKDCAGAQRDAPFMNKITTRSYFSGGILAPQTTTPGARVALTGSDLEVQTQVAAPLAYRDNSTDAYQARLKKACAVSPKLIIKRLFANQDVYSQPSSAEEAAIKQLAEGFAHFVANLGGKTAYTGQASWEDKSPRPSVWTTVKYSRVKGLVLPWNIVWAKAQGEYADINDARYDTESNTIFLICPDITQIGAYDFFRRVVYKAIEAYAAQILETDSEYWGAGLHNTAARNYHAHSVAALYLQNDPALAFGDTGLSDEKLAQMPIEDILNLRGDAREAAKERLRYIVLQMANPGRVYHPDNDSQEARRNELWAKILGKISSLEELNALGLNIAGFHPKNDLAARKYSTDITGYEAASLLASAALMGREKGVNVLQQLLDVSPYFGRDYNATDLLKAIAELAHSSNSNFRRHALNIAQKVRQLSYKPGAMGGVGHGPDINSLALMVYNKVDDALLRANLSFFSVKNAIADRDYYPGMQWGDLYLGSRLQFIQKMQALGILADANYNGRDLVEILGDLARVKDILHEMHMDTSHKVDEWYNVEADYVTKRVCRAAVAMAVIYRLPKKQREKIWNDPVAREKLQIARAYFDRAFSRIGPAVQEVFWQNDGQKILNFFDNLPLNYPETVKRKAGSAQSGRHDSFYQKVLASAIEKGPRYLLMEALSGNGATEPFTQINISQLSSDAADSVRLLLGRLDQAARVNVGPGWDSIDLNEAILQANIVWVDSTGLKRGAVRAANIVWAVRPGVQGAAIDDGHSGLARRAVYIICPDITRKTRGDIWRIVVHEDIELEIKKQYQKDNRQWDEAAARRAHSLAENYIQSQAWLAYADTDFNDERLARASLQDLRALPQHTRDLLAQRLRYMVLNLAHKEAFYRPDEAQIEQWQNILAKFSLDELKQWGVDLYSLIPEPDEAARIDSSHITVGEAVSVVAALAIMPSEKYKSALQEFMENSPLISKFPVYGALAWIGMRYGSERGLSEKIIDAISRINKPIVKGADIFKSIELDSPAPLAYRYLRPRAVAQIITMLRGLSARELRSFLSRLASEDKRNFRRNLGWANLSIDGADSGDPGNLEASLAFIEKISGQGMMPELSFEVRDVVDTLGDLTDPEINFSDPVHVDTNNPLRANRYMNARFARIAVAMAILCADSRPLRYDPRLTSGMEIAKAYFVKAFTRVPADLAKAFMDHNGANIAREMGITLPQRELSPDAAEDDLGGVDFQGINVQVSGKLLPMELPDVDFSRLNGLGLEILSIKPSVSQ